VETTATEILNSTKFLINFVSFAAALLEIMFRCTMANTQCATFAIARCSSGADSGTGGY